MRKSAIIFTSIFLIVLGILQTQIYHPFQSTFAQNISGSKEIIFRIEKIEEKINNLEGNNKDGWDIFKIIASLLIPASITLVGYFVSNAMKMAEINSAQSQATAQQEIAKLNTKIEQANLISKLIDSLTSRNSSTRLLAVSLVNFAIPDLNEAETILRYVALNDPDSTVKEAAAKSALTLVNLPSLVGNLFSNNEQEFKKASEQLKVYGSVETTALLTLLDIAIGHLEKDDHLDKERAVKEILRLIDSVDLSLSKIFPDVWERFKMYSHDFTDRDIIRLVNQLDSKFIDNQ